MDTPRDGGRRVEPDEVAPGVALSETHAYVEQSSPMTYEGVIAAYGNIAHETKHGTGWRRIVGFAIFVMVLAPIAAGFVLVVVNAINKL